MTVLVSKLGPGATLRQALSPSRPAIQQSLATVCQNATVGIVDTPGKLALVAGCAITVLGVNMLVLSQETSTQQTTPNTALTRNGQQSAALPDLTQVEQQASEAINAYTGKENLTADCQGPGEVWPIPGREAYVGADSQGILDTVVHLSASACTQIAQTLTFQQPRIPRGGDLTTVHILAHEAEHLGGTVDEAVAECQAMQKLDTMGIALGIEPQIAKTYPKTYYQQTWDTLPGQYRAADCAENQAGDHSPNDGDFP